jgi:flagellar protein FlaG
MSIPATPAEHNSLRTQPVPGRPAGTGPVAAPDRAEAPLGTVDAATPTQIEHAVGEVNASLESRSVGLQFEVDRDTDKVIVKVVDRSSGEVIRQIPSEEVVRIAKVLGKAAGLLVSQSA